MPLYKGIAGHLSSLSSSCTQGCSRHSSGNARSAAAALFATSPSLEQKSGLVPRLHPPSLCYGFCTLCFHAAVVNEAPSQQGCPGFKQLSHHKGAKSPTKGEQGDSGKTGGAKLEAKLLQDNRAVVSLGALLLPLKLSVSCDFESTRDCILKLPSVSNLPA